MIRKPVLLAAAATLLLLCVPAPSPAKAETEYTAAAAARLLREGRDSDQYAVWETTVVHLYRNDAVRDHFLVRSMLACLTGQGCAPDTEPGLRFMPCYEVPMPSDGMTLYKGAQYNFHGLVLSDSPLTEVSLTVEPRGGSSKAQSAAIRIPAEDGLLRFSLDDDTAGGKRTLNEMIDMRVLSTGRHRLTLSASNAAGAKKTLYQADFTVEDSKNSYPLMQCNFGDNYSWAERFFGSDDTKAFMPNYSLKTEGGRVVSLSTEWRDRYLVDTKTILGRCHEKAYPYFMKAWEYLNNTYVRLHQKNRSSRIMPLVSLIGSTCDSYVPRFQSNERYISHHSLGTCLDVNYDYYPNNNIETNHQVIGDDVREHLTYNGIMEDENGLRYYDFTYTGSYPAKVNHIPKSIINYLLYELAFYRAGFSWGFYYINSCDGMHFTLSDCDYSRHDNPIMGLRKVYEYCD